MRAISIPNPQSIVSQHGLDLLSLCIHQNEPLFASAVKQDFKKYFRGISSEIEWNRCIYSEFTCFIGLKVILQTFSALLIPHTAYHLFFCRFRHSKSQLLLNYITLTCIHCWNTAYTSSVGLGIICWYHTNWLYLKCQMLLPKDQ